MSKTSGGLTVVGGGRGGRRSGGKGRWSLLLRERAEFSASYCTVLPSSDVLLLSLSLSLSDLRFLAFGSDIYEDVDDEMFMFLD